MAKRSPKTAKRKAASTSKAAKSKYTKPALRERIKNRILRGSKGGRAGQWSARKAQLVAAAYRKAGGGYKGGRGTAQKHLKKWTKEAWTTADGEPARRQGTMHRYLPKKAWAKLAPAQRRATDRKKVAGSRKGRQFVANTAAARKSRRRATAGE